MSVKLSLVVGDYVQNANKAAGATRSIADAANQLGPAQQALQGLQRTGADLGVTLGAIGAVGLGALAGMTTQAISAGVAYNSLQQTAGSALETLLGSAEAASAQMEELAAFAKTSPFPRQMWIQAQQQLIGFGVAAEDVIPIFSALQDGVVAVGGSAQQIEEVVLILAKLSSTGKITGEDLNQLGERGIDAATLVGEAWGMTAAEIRDSISAGAVDATDFMDTLVAQLGTKYEGAAEGLRATWVGALDRIKGATRDIGSAIVEPFIDPQGGGAAVEWANDMADALRAFEAALKPAVAVLEERAEPAFQKAGEAVQRFTEYIADIDIVEILDHLAAGAPILTAFGAAAAAAGSASALSAIGMGGLAASINPVAAGILGLAVASPAFRDALADMLSVVAPLIPALAKLGVQIAEGLTMAIDSLLPFVEVAIGLVGGMISMFTALPEPIQQAAIAVGLFGLALKKLGPLGVVISGVTFIATAVSSLGGETKEASVDVNTLAEDLKNLQKLGRTFEVQEIDFASITGPLRDAMSRIESSMGKGGWAELSASGEAYIEVLNGVLWITQKMADEQGDLSSLVRQGDGDMEAFTETVDTLDKAMVQLIGEGMSAKDALELVGEATGMSQEELALILPLMDEYQAAAEQQAAENEQAAEGQREFANSVGASVAALQELADEMRAQVDPVFAAIRALNAYEAAQDAYNEAVEEHGAASDEAIEAEMALVEAYLAAAAAAGEMAKATGGEIPQELLHAAEAAGLSEEAIALLEEQFNEAKNAGEEFGAQLTDLSTETGKLGAITALETAGMESSYAKAIINSKAYLDSLMAAGYSYEEALRMTAQQSNTSTGVIEQGFQDARDAGLDFSDDYPAHIRLTGYDQTMDRIESLGRAIHNVPSYKRVQIEYEQTGIKPPSGEMPYSRGGRVGGPLGAGDVVPARLTPGEHVWTRAEVDAVGGHDALEAMRAAALSGQTMYAQSGARPVVSMPAPAPMGPLTATAVIDLGRGITQRIRLEFEDHDRDLRRRVQMGTGRSR